LRNRTIDVPEPIKPKDTKQPKKIKDKAVLTEPSDKTDPNPKEVTVEDVTEIHASKNQPFVSSSSKENVSSAPKNTSETEILQDNTEDQKEIAENVVEKGKSASHNTKTQSKKPFDLEAKIGKLKISIPLSKLAKHDVYRQQINRLLQMP